MPSSIEGMAFPARIFVNSLSANAIALSILSAVSSSINFIRSFIGIYLQSKILFFLKRLADKSSYTLSLCQFEEVTCLVHIKDNNGQIVFLAKCKSGHIHHTESFVKNLLKGQFFETSRC